MALTDKQEKYVQNLIKGMSQRKAYWDAFPHSKNWKDKTVDSKASTLYNSEKAQERYTELKDKIDKKIEKKFMLEIDDILEDIIETRNACKEYMYVKDDKGNIVGIDNTALNGRSKNNELLGKYKKMFTDRVESVNVNVDMTEEEAKEYLKSQGIDPEKQK